MKNNDSLKSQQIKNTSQNDVITNKNELLDLVSKESICYQQKFVEQKRNENKTSVCKKAECQRPSFKQEQYYYQQLQKIYSLCKHHFSNLVKAAIRKELRNIYRAPEKAYSSMDFTGLGFITENDFLNSLALQRIPFTQEDVKEFLKQSNLFCSSSNQKSDKANKIPPNTINFDIFKKMFFPQLFQINDEQDSDDDKQAKQNKREIRDNKEQQPQIIEDRLKRLEKILKNKFSNNWESVRKAFLALDSDYDGYITVEDILRYFGQEKDFSYNDLKKLIQDKDSKKIGKIGYSDFSKWVGNAIHMSEGFYFRHDSIKNPQYEMNLQKLQQKQQQNQQQISNSLINTNLEKTILDKMQFQWKTLRKAFMDLNMEKSGAILPEELRFYFKHWGLNVTDEQFKYLFDKFDLDKDGKISYKDFQLTVGSEIHPAEGLYFRQEKLQIQKVNSCKHDKCWQPTQGINFCQMHLKMHQEDCIKLFSKIFNKIGHKWRLFIEQIRKNAEKDDLNQIFFDQFITILKKFGIELKEQDVQNLLDSFPGRDEGQNKRLNISRLYDQKYNILLAKMYKQINVHENDGSDDPVDQSGYLGQFYREKQTLLPITEQELIQIINNNNKLKDIVRMIKEIDAQHNGYVTSTELDDIFKIVYKDELEKRDLKNIFKKYSSIQNRILIDYKKFKEDIVQQVKMFNSNFTLSTTNMTQSKKEENFQSQKSIKEENNQISMNHVETLLKLKELTRPKTRQIISNNKSQYSTQQIIDVNKTYDESSQQYKNNQMSSIEIRKTNNYFGLNTSAQDIQKQTNRSLLQKKSLQSTINTIKQQKQKRQSIQISKRDIEAFKGIPEFKRTKTIDQSTTYLCQENLKNLTLNESSKHIIPDQKFKDVLKSKLGYEWKNIYRQLLLSDKDGKGLVSKQEFEICTHQSGVFLTREDMMRIMSIYGNSQNEINLNQITNDLGINSSSFAFIKTPKSRIQKVQQLRALYSSSEMKRPKRNNTNIGQKSINIINPEQIEQSQNDVKQVLLRKIREFRDLVHLYQRKNNAGSAILPISEFKAILNNIGISLSSKNIQILSRFLTQQINQSGLNNTYKGKERSRTSTSYGQFYNTISHLNGSGIDVQGFLKFYLC